MNKASSSLMTQVYEERQHLKHPIPRSLEIQTIGHTLTELEWMKFKKRNLNQKLQQYVVRKQEGTLHFYGEYGVDAALILKQKFPHRFHFKLISDTKDTASLGLLMANQLGIPISEAQFKNDRYEKVNVNDKRIMIQLVKAGKVIH